MFSITGYGRLTKDPEVKVIREDLVVVNFSLASDRYDPKAESKKTTDFLDCKCWGKRGQTIASHFNKGDPIVVYGALQIEKWEAKDGGNRSKPIFVVDNFEFTSGKKKKENGEGAPKPESKPHIGGSPW